MYEDSVLAELALISNYLSRVVFGGDWTEAQAAWFVLTGEDTPVAAIVGNLAAG